jgi:hypothetical protein
LKLVDEPAVQLMQSSDTADGAYFPTKHFSHEVMLNTKVPGSQLSHVTRSAVDIFPVAHFPQSLDTLLCNDAFVEKSVFTLPAGHRSHSTPPREVLTRPARQIAHDEAPV